MGAVNDIYLFQARGVIAGQDIIHTLHFKSAVVGSDSAIQQDLIDSWQATSQAGFLAIFYSGYTLVDLTAQRVCGGTPLPAATIETVNLTGTQGALATSQTLPVWMSSLVRERTGFAGREYAGRFFLPVMSETSVEQNVLVSTYTTLVTTYITSLASYLVGGADADWDLFVRSRKLAAVPGVQCQNTGAGVTSMAVSPYITSMRSRRSRTGA